MIYTANNHFDVSIKNLQEDTNSIALWCKKNGISVNKDKSKVMVFGRKCCLAKLPSFEIKCGQTPLQLVTTYKYLGVTLDGQLNYDQHVARIICLVTSKLKQFRRMRFFLSAKAALMVYKGTVLPLLEYGDVFLHAASVDNRKRLQTLQNKVYAVLLIEELILVPLTYTLRRNY